MLVVVGVESVAVAVQLLPFAVELQQLAVQQQQLAVELQQLAVHLQQLAVELQQLAVHLQQLAVHPQQLAARLLLLLAVGGDKGVQVLPRLVHKWELLLQSWPLAVGEALPSVVVCRFNHVKLSIPELVY
jgi:hypothetical protein